MKVRKAFRDVANAANDVASAHVNLSVSNYSLMIVVTAISSALLYTIFTAQRRCIDKSTCIRVSLGVVCGQLLTLK